MKKILYVYSSINNKGEFSGGIYENGPDAKIAYLTLLNVLDQNHGKSAILFFNKLK